MKMATVFEAAAAAKIYLTSIWGGKICDCLIQQEGGTYVIWATFTDGCSHLVYVDVNTGKLIDDIMF